MQLTLTRRMMIAAGLSFWGTSAFGAQKSYTLNEDGSKISFIFTTGATEQSGTVPVQRADITVDTANLARSSADVTADIRTINSGLFLITEAIKSAELLDAANHPIVRFQSTRVRLGARGRISEGAILEGDLTLRGVTLPIALDATLSRPAGTPPDDLSVLYIKLTGVISRSAFGASGYASLAEDNVKLDILAEIRARA